MGNSIGFQMFFIISVTKVSKIMEVFGSRHRLLREKKKFFLPLEAKKYRGSFDMIFGITKLTLLGHHLTWDCHQISTSAIYSGVCLPSFALLLLSESFMKTPFRSLHSVSALYAIVLIKIGNFNAERRETQVLLSRLGDPQPLGSIFFAKRHC